MAAADWAQVMLPRKNYLYKIIESVKTTNMILKIKCFLNLYISCNIRYITRNNDITIDWSL